MHIRDLCMLFLFALLLRNSYGGASSRHVPGFRSVLENEQYGISLQSGTGSQSQSQPQNMPDNNTDPLKQLDMSLKWLISASSDIQEILDAASVLSQVQQSISDMEKLQALHSDTALLEVRPWDAFVHPISEGAEDLLPKQQAREFESQSSELGLDGYISSDSYYDAWNEELVWRPYLENGNDNDLQSDVEVADEGDDEQLICYEAASTQPADEQEPGVRLVTWRNVFNLSKSVVQRALPVAPIAEAQANWAQDNENIILQQALGSAGELTAVSRHLHQQLGDSKGGGEQQAGVGAQQDVGATSSSSGGGSVVNGHLGPSEGGGGSGGPDGQYQQQGWGPGGEGSGGPDGQYQQQGWGPGGEGSGGPGGVLPPLPKANINTRWVHFNGNDDGSNTLVVGSRLFPIVTVDKAADGSVIAKEGPLSGKR
ncbi:hypothetical protein CEUSTIGMA_g7454.t1 [Chlamydomonas eustigma]|uniref:Uncharacterized protein n=1 Tax=Chlamydomonas eustigma TaxID=1157962 RepID=A0A250XA84_9CHLO|nr:hypothetical protein CEUSTIGMA_g7454.t1 [Chlamydomonas eustigma]|eukprot:GAX80015.1 hypothetical protein CEUSTIGMA_g7454.t1 [Chlamydomonas eustigma]